MPRRTPSQQAADLRAKAAALEWRAKVASSPVLKCAIKLRELVGVIDDDPDGTLSELQGALDLYIDDPAERERRAQK